MRLRTVKTKGCLSRKTALAMAFKLILSARRKWRKLDGSNQLAETRRRSAVQGRNQDNQTRRLIAPSPTFGHSSSHLRGASYGLRQSLDTFGAFVGPLLAIAFMVLLANDIQAVYWIAVIPAFISVAILIFAVKEPDKPRSEGKATFANKDSRPGSNRSGVLVAGDRWCSDIVGSI